MKTVAQRAALLLFAGAFFLALPGRAQKPDTPAISPAKAALIERVLELTGSAKIGEQMLDAMTETFRKTAPEIPEEFYQSFRSEVDMGGLIQMIIPIYDRHYSEEDLRGLVAFYESPLGRKVTAELPGIMSESMAVGQEWGMEIGTRIMRRLEAERLEAEKDEQKRKPKEGQEGAAL